jgi:dTDP-4-dehydrorhamnose reductase
MRIFVVGRNGQLARSLSEAAASVDGLILRCGCRPDIDLLKPESLSAAISNFSPDIVINPAAYTAVDRAESEPELAFAINRDGAGVVAACAADVGASVIHLSTDYVFDGRRTGPYVETDAVGPTTVYGRSKLEGELAVAKANPNHIIARTSWLYSPFGANFVRTMLRLAGERDRVRVVDDQVGCPTYALDIAGSIIEIAQRWMSAEDPARYAGILHLAGSEAMTWYKFACAIFSGIAARGGKSLPVDRISTAEYPTPALRPANSRLSTARLEALFDIRLPRTEVSLANCLDRLMKGEGGVV